MSTPLSVLLAICAALLTAHAADAVDPPMLYPGASTPGTHVLDHKALLGRVDDPGWYEANIPFLDIPDRQIQQVYYYRWQTYKEHLVYTGPIYGWLSTEFLEPASYGAPYGGIDAAAGHQITEGRWLRDQQYVKDDIDYWLNGPGRFDKPRTDFVNADASDWAHEYSFWAASSVWQTYLAWGDKSFATALNPTLVRQYLGWDNHYNPKIGLYWQVPVWDATEFTPASYESADAYHGGAGYRPTINAYQYGDARAIASIAALAGDKSTAVEYTNRADRLRSAMQKYLWDPKREFFFHMNRDSNPSHALLDTREEEGFVPWMFDMPQASDSVAFAELLDPQGFLAPYGPTTAERRSRWFMRDAAGCCHWDGPSWPYETSQTLTGLANLLDDYPSTASSNSKFHIPNSTFSSLLRTYALTQFKNGAPYVAEAHDPDKDVWIYDSLGHSEDYNHSTFVDNVISGLIGLRGQPGDTLQIKPLTPSTWPYFALENTPYHGHNVSVFWDRTGKRYRLGPGLTVFVDGVRRAHKSTPGPLTISVGASITQSNAGGLVDAAANGRRFDNGPKPFAGYTSPHDNVWNAIDGIVYRTGIPENSRWTSYASPNASDYYGVQFPTPITTMEIRLTFYDDGGGVRVPTTYDLQYWTGSTWAAVPRQTRTPSRPAPNALTRITFPPVTTPWLRVVAPNPGGGMGWGLSEFEVMTHPVFQIVDADTGRLLTYSLDVSRDETKLTASPSPRTQWELIDAGGGWFKIKNLGTGALLGRNHPLWRFIDAGGGRFEIMNSYEGGHLGPPDEQWIMRITGFK